MYTAENAGDTAGSIPPVGVLARRRVVMSHAAGQEALSGVPGLGEVDNYHPARERPVAHFLRV